MAIGVRSGDHAAVLEHMARADLSGLDRTTVQ